MVHIPGESRRAYIHICTCRQGRPGGCSGNAESADVAESAGICAISGETLTGFLNFLERFITPNPHSPSTIRKEYIPIKSLRRVIGWKGYIFMAKPGAYTSKSVLVVAGVRAGFVENAESAGICAILRTNR